MNVRMALVVLALAVPAAVSAQKPAAQPAPRQMSAPSASPLLAAAQSLLGYYGGNLKGAAEAMPAEKYGFKPTPQQMTFGEIVHHVAASNIHLCANLSGLPAPADKLPEATAPKAELVEAMQKSLDFCTQAVGQVDESKLGDEVPFFGTRKATRAMVLLAVTGDLFDHYSAMAIYLRLNGLLPPTARQREGA